MSVHFTQSCPTCGRRVQVRAALIGYTVVCQHCNAEFEANSGDHSELHSISAVDHPMADPLMDRVERALKRAADHSPLV